MATKVLDIELTQIPAAIDDLHGYERALVLFRYKGRPVAQAQLPVSDGRLNQTELEDAALNGGNWALWEQMTHDYLEWDPSHAPHSTLQPATVAVCTRDRPGDLKRCLEALLRLPDDGQEILVVDNAPATDQTKRLMAAYNGRVRYIREPRPGLNVARNRALREAKHEIIAFNDDDAVPDPNWLRALLKNFTDPAILCVTGLTMPLELETKAQEWFERYSPFGRGFQRRLFYGAPEQALSAGHAGAGANMALRRDLLQKVGPFDEALDAGTPTRSGGDTEIFTRIFLNGYHIVYDPGALTWHRHRRTWPELRRVAYGYGVGAYALWTRTLLRERKLGVLVAAWQHLLYYQLPLLLRALLRRPQHLPLDLILAELLGCLAGPRAYFRSRRQLQRAR